MAFFTNMSSEGMENKIVTEYVKKRKWQALQDYLVATPSFEYNSPLAAYIMFEAITANNLNVVKMLVARGTNIDSHSSTGTPLIVAIQQKRKEIADYLIENGADIDARDADGKTPLMHCGLRTRGIAVNLIRKGANVNARDVNGRSVLDLFIYRRMGSSPESWDKDYESGTPSPIHILFEAGVNPNVRDNKGETPLMTALKARNRNMAAFLLRQNVDIQATDSHGNTALVLAAQHHYVDVAHTLIRMGATVNVANTEGNTPLLYALRQNPHFPHQTTNNALVETLIERGADINVMNNDKETPLIVAAESENTTMLSALIRKKANLDAQNLDGDTALIIMARAQNYNGVFNLLYHGANPQMANNDGKTAFDQWDKVPEINSNAKRKKRLKELYYMYGSRQRILQLQRRPTEAADLRDLPPEMLQEISRIHLEESNASPDNATPESGSQGGGAALAFSHLIL